MNILEQICADKRIEIEARKQEQSFAALEALVPETAARPDFVQALRSAPMGLIAELKRRSPSAGAIREPFDPIAIARSYEAHGAQAISCLMDHNYFGGGADDFSAVRGAVELPMLYKEFVVDPWQIVHAKVMGASAVLLIAAVLADSDLIAFMEQVRSLGLAALVEVHDREEMKRAIDCGADCIGINNRNLKTFVTSLETTFELAAIAPVAATLVSESGIKTPGDVVFLKKIGVHAVLVGESLLRESDPGIAVKHLMSAL